MPASYSNPANPCHGVYNIGMQTLAVVVGVVGGIIAILIALVALWSIPLYKRLTKIHKEIRIKNDEIDAIEPDINARTVGKMVTEAQRLAQVENAKEPLLRQLERLEQERQFVVDKLPFFK